MEKKQSKFKGYFLTIVCGLVVIAGTLFLVLQYPPDLTATVSIYGEYTIPPVKTIWVIVISALLGPVFLLCCWWLLRGMWILYTIRRAEARKIKAADAAVTRAQQRADGAEPAEDESPDAPEESADEAPADEPADEAADEPADGPAPRPDDDSDPPA